MFQLRWPLGIGVGAMVLCALIVGACSDESGSETDPTGEVPGVGPGPAPTSTTGVPPEEPGDKVLGASAGGRTNVISDGWPEAPVRLGDNLKMLNVKQMKAEILRATGVQATELDQSRAAFGEPDFVSTFRFDRLPSGTKLTTWRKLMFPICTSMVTGANTSSALFTAVSPTAAINATDANVTKQIGLMFTKFYRETATPEEVEASKTALVETVQQGSAPAAAWAVLCVGYLSSMRFLTY